MIDTHLDDLAAVTSKRQACELLGQPRASHYRRCQPPQQGPAVPRPAPPNKLSETERQQVLAVLRSPECCDLAPAQIWARLLDDGIYLCSISTMYRLLVVVGENRERRRQRSAAAISGAVICRNDGHACSLKPIKASGPSQRCATAHRRAAADAIADHLGPGV